MILIDWIWEKRHDLVDRVENTIFQEGDSKKKKNSEMKV